MSIRRPNWHSVWVHRKICSTQFGQTKSSLLLAATLAQFSSSFFHTQSIFFSPRLVGANRDNFVFIVSANGGNLPWFTICVWKQTENKYHHYSWIVVVLLLLFEQTKQRQQKKKKEKKKYMEEVRSRQEIFTLRGSGNRSGWEFENEKEGKRISAFCLFSQPPCGHTAKTGARRLRLTNWPVWNRCEKKKQQKKNTKNKKRSFFSFHFFFKIIHSFPSSSSCLFSIGLLIHSFSYLFIPFCFITSSRLPKLLVAYHFLFNENRKWLLARKMMPAVFFSFHLIINLLHNQNNVNQKSKILCKL